MAGLRKPGAVAAIALLAIATLIVASSGDILAGGKDDEAKVKERKAFLGVTMQELTEELADGLGIRMAKGVLVNEVIDDSPAAEAGIKDGDVITKFDGKEVNSPDDLIVAVKAAEVGREVKIEVTRENRAKTFTVTLGEWPERDFLGFVAPDIDIPNHFELVDIFNRGRLGVRVTELDEDLAPYFGVKEDEGVLVLGVNDESTAEEMGLKSGDVIKRVEGKEVSSSRDIRKALEDLDEGDKVKVNVVRQKKEMSLEGEMKSSAFRWHGGRAFVAPEARHFRLDDRDLRKELDQLRKELDELRAELEKSKTG